MRALVANTRSYTVIGGQATVMWPFRRPPTKSMQSSEAVRQIVELGIVPIVRTADAESAVRSVEAISEGGIPCAEITMTVQGAVRALEEVAKRFGDSILL